MRDNIKKKTRFIDRLESDFSSSIFQLLQQRKMENITVSDLCEYTNYPRSTFYKYYYDLEDLFTDYLLNIWDESDFSECDSFYHAAVRLYDYQEKNDMCRQVFAVNKGSTLFLECFEKVLRREISKMGYMEAAVAASCFPSADLVTDYIIKIASLLKDSMADLDHAELDNMARILLDQPFRVA